MHERTVQSDFLLIALKTILMKRPNDFHVILMSATMNSEKVSRYFNGAPIIAVPGRTFPVSVTHLEDIVELTQYIVSEDSFYAGSRHKITQGNNQSGVRIKMSRNVKRGNLEYDHEEHFEGANDYRFKCKFHRRTRCLFPYTDGGSHSWDVKRNSWWRSPHQ